MPKELTVMLIARRSASKERISSMMVFVGEGSLVQKFIKSSRYAL